MRFQAMRATHTHFFKPTGVAAFWGFALCVGPIAGIYYLQRRERDAKEAKFRNGEVSYRDREFKFI